jgi:hypothetical protein
MGSRAVPPFSRKLMMPVARKVRFALGKVARLHTYAGDTGSAFSLLDSRFRLNSLGGGQGASFARGLAHFVDGDHTAAAEWMEKELWECPNSVA